MAAVATDAALTVEPAHDLAALRDPWDELAAQSGNVFATWEWSATWWRHFGRGRQLLVNACRDAGGRVVAILPLYLWVHRPLRAARLLGHGPGDQLAPVCAPETRAAAAHALRAALSRANIDVFLGEQVSRAERWSELLGATVLRREGSPVLRIEGARWEDLLAGWSRNLREQVRRRERRLAREHELRFRLVDDGAALESAFDALFTFHSARWRRSAFARDQQAFHREFARRALERGWLRFWVLELEGQPAAAWYGFRFGGVESYYQSGRDPAWDHASPGFVVLAHSIREAVTDGMREYRFLRGGEEYKYRFADHDPGLETIAISRNPVGRAAVEVGVARLRASDVLARQRARRSASRATESGRAASGAGSASRKCE